jgi:hypothetical protein
MKKKLKSTVKIQGKASGELEVKRFYVPGVIVESTCPNCGSKKEKDLSVEYFDYPSINKSQDFYFYCEAEIDKKKGGKPNTLNPEDKNHYCQTEWLVPLKLELSVKKG